jgi:hypothetical protein
MSPEQLAGKEVTVRSDIYALGLVLYELFTGKRAFDASSLKELIQLQERGAPPSLTSAVKDADPAVEQVIVRCLSHEPLRRPSSVLAVAGEAGNQQRWQTMAWLAAALAGVALAGWYTARICITNTVRMDAPPQAPGAPVPQLVEVARLYEAAVRRQGQLRLQPRPGEPSGATSRLRRLVSGRALRPFRP